MKLAVMQPYYFPYLGYWQLINTVDKFVIYDDVNYIKGGWINRNNILINENTSYITIPLIKSSQNKNVCELLMQDNLPWRKKTLKTIENTYSKATYFSDIFPLMEQIIHHGTNSLVDFLHYQLTILTKYMDINTEIVISSHEYENTHLTAQDRILDICIKENTDTYFNPEGGTKLYEKSIFNKNNIELFFLKMKPLEYPQRAKQFMPYLSIIDLLMAVQKNKIKNHLNSFELI